MTRRLCNSLTLVNRNRDTVVENNLKLHPTLAEASRPGSPTLSRDQRLSILFSVAIYQSQVKFALSNVTSYRKKPVS